MISCFFFSIQILSFHLVFISHRGNSPPTPKETFVDARHCDKTRVASKLASCPNSAFKFNACASLTFYNSCTIGEIFAQSILSKRRRRAAVHTAPCDCSGSKLATVKHDNDCFQCNAVRFDGERLKHFQGQKAISNADYWDSALARFLNS